MNSLAEHVAWFLGIGGLMTWKRNWLDTALNTAVSAAARIGRHVIKFKKLYPLLIPVILVYGHDVIVPPDFGFDSFSEHFGFWLLVFLTVGSCGNYIGLILNLKAAARENAIGLFVLHFAMLAGAWLTFVYGLETQHIFFLWSLYGGYCYQNWCQALLGSDKQAVIGLGFLIQENAPSFLAYGLLWVLSLFVHHLHIEGWLVSSELLQGAAAFHLSVSAIRYFVVSYAKKDPLEAALDQLGETGCTALRQEIVCPGFLKWWTEVAGCALASGAVIWLAETVRGLGKFGWGWGW
jgi:hypothetical protein